MMEKKSNKKVSVSAIEKAVASGYENVVECEWRGINVTITRTISLRELLSIAGDVSASCFSSDGTYTPEILDFAIKKCAIDAYTNIRMPENVEKCYDIIYRSDLFDFVYNNIDQKQFCELVNSIKEKVKVMADVSIAALRKDVCSIIGIAEDVVKKMTDAFGNVDPNDIKAAIGTLSSGMIDEKKLLDAIVDKQKE